MVIVRVYFRLVAAVKRREDFGFRIAGEILWRHPRLVHELEQADHCLFGVVVVRVVIGGGVVVRLRVVAVASAATLDLDELEQEDAEEAEDEAGDDEDAAGVFGALLLDDLEEDDVDEGAGGEALDCYSVRS